ncbi:MAG TPA: HEAT repeat domain-containing protein, partial [Pyrinomonadaceae bacterium]|nr:HEAT repeat domain-containing protein [Pyrinomonadaceae bacterium]
TLLQKNAEGQAEESEASLITVTDESVFSLLTEEDESDTITIEQHDAEADVQTVYEAALVFETDSEPGNADQVVVDVLAKSLDLAGNERGIDPVDGENPVISALGERLKSDEVAERVAALEDLAREGGDQAFQLITRSFDDPVEEVRNATAQALYELKTDRADSFTMALREGSPERRRRIGVALAGSGIAAEAINNLVGESREKTYEAFSILFLMAKAGGVQPLLDAIQDHPHVEVRLAVIKLLAFSNQSEIVPSFRRLAVRGSLPPEVRSAVMEAIHEMNSQSQPTPQTLA